MAIDQLIRLLGVGFIEIITAFIDRGGGFALNLAFKLLLGRLCSHGLVEHVLSGGHSSHGRVVFRLPSLFHRTCHFLWPLILNIISGRLRCSWTVLE